MMGQGLKLYKTYLRVQTSKRIRSKSSKNIEIKKDLYNTNTILSEHSKIVLFVPHCH